MDNSRFSFGGMVSEGTCYIGRETPCPMHKDVDPSFHFAIEYLPDRMEILDSDRPAPRPNGFSGSIVWDTGFVRCHQEGLEWNPNMAKVTGVVWGWPSSHGVIVATKIEHIHPFLEVAKSQILAQL
ncbi:hypothetical protein INP77_00470 [Methylophilus sp. 13]|uniref:hypothetical protein n=1 Tax=Methylophilus sp. 13 TaxID=2781018 RepID=UPI00188F4319|nr:hypothetical protein [Methylophilus sp. 13]MBF5037955.1 hypothetical protein [Methylophilus sp. 13]